MECSAALSPDRVYRYSLSRSWGPGPAVLFVGLNPSTADEATDDPTIRRCIGFARAWGFDRLHMGNLFAFRATAPAQMLATADPVGPENDRYLVTLANESDLIVAAWGSKGTHLGRDLAIRQMLPGLHFLRLTRNGQPGHPLYLSKDLRPKPWG